MKEIPKPKIIEDKSSGQENQLDQLKKESLELEKQNQEIEKMPKGEERDKKIEKADLLNEKLEQLEEITDLTEEEIMNEYKSLSLEIAEKGIDELLDNLNNSLSAKETEAIRIDIKQGNFNKFVESVKKLFPQKLAFATACVLLIMVVGIGTIAVSPASAKEGTPVEELRSKLPEDARKRLERKANRINKRFKEKQANTNKTLERARTLANKMELGFANEVIAKDGIPVKIGDRFVPLELLTKDERQKIKKALMVGGHNMSPEEYADLSGISVEEAKKKIAEEQKLNNYLSNELNKLGDAEEHKGKTKKNKNDSSYKKKSRNKTLSGYGVKMGEEYMSLDDF